MESKALSELKAIESAILLFLVVVVVVSLLVLVISPLVLIRHQS